MAERVGLGVGPSSNRLEILMLLILKHFLRGLGVHKGSTHGSFNVASI